MAKKQYYYLDASILLVPNFYLQIEQLLRSAQPNFLIDSAIYHDIETYRAVGAEAQARTLESYVNLLANLGCAAMIDTQGGFAAEALAPMAQQELFVLTQQASVADIFSAVASGAHLLRIQNGELLPWPADMNENKPAFYPERDGYVEQFDIDEIEYVFSPRYGYLKLDKSSALSGGEGVCYRTYNGLLCKLYFKKHITYVNFKKLQTMVEMGCTCPYIAWPQDILYYRNQFVGYVMEELHDTRSIDELRDDGFAGFTVLDRFYIVRNFLRCVEYLHARGILVGDMKLDNILVRPNKDVHIIDSGSFQVRDYSCDVCHKEYTQKLYMGDELKYILRTTKEEYFPINKIIFEILMMKGPFYSRDNTEIDGDGSREFTYPMDPAELAGQTVPYYLKVWFALSPEMRRFFHRYFTEGKVTSLGDWLRELDAYILAKEAAAAKRKQNA